MEGNEATTLSSEKKTRLPSSNFWLITSLIVMVLSIAWFFYVIRSSTKVASKPTPIVSAPVVNRDMPIYLSALGNVTPIYNVTVHSQIMGVLQKVFFKEGQFVKKGDLLAQIDPRPYEALLKQYKGNLMRDKALLANARIDLKRYQDLWKQDSVSQQTLATQQALVEQYEGAVKTDEGLIESTKINLIYCRIVSPISGRIGLRLVDAGNLIQLSDTTGIAVITTINPITVIFSLPEDYIPGLINQVYDNEAMKVYVYDRQQEQLLASGRLLTLDNQIDPNTGTVKLRAQFANKKNKLFPNQFVNIKILVDTLKNAVVVPTAAVQHTLTYDFVYLVDKQTVVIKKISTGPSIGNETVINKGLTPGQLVVIEGADKLVSGAHVINEQEKSKSKPKKSQTT